VFKVLGRKEKKIVYVYSMYKQGQVDLIEDIKSRLLTLAHTSNEVDLLFDLIHLLKNLEPIENKRVLQDNKTSTKT